MRKLLVMRIDEGESEMSRPKRHKILVEVTDYENLSTKRICQFIHRGIELAHRDSPYDLANIQVKSLARVINGLLRTYSLNHVLSKLGGRT